MKRAGNMENSVSAMSPLSHFEYLRSNNLQPSFNWLNNYLKFNTFGNSSEVRRAGGIKPVVCI